MPNFSNWAQLKLFTTKIGSGITPRGGDATYQKSGIPLIRSQNVRDGKLVLAQVAFIDDAQHNSMKNSWVQPLDVLFNITGASIGRSCVVPEHINSANVNQHVCIIRLNNELDPYYVSCFLNSAFGQKQVCSFQSGGSREGLNYAQVGAFLLPIPPLPEQRRISTIARCWDDGIQKTTRLIEITKQRRDYLLDNLLDQRGWSARPIGSFLSHVSRPVPTPNTAYTALGIRSHGKGTFQRLIERPAEVDMDTVYVVNPKDLIVNITFAWEGAIALAEPEDSGCFVSHRFPTFEIDEDKMNRKFLGYAVKRRRFIYQLGIASPGGAGRNRVLKKNEFLKIPIPAPRLDEQNRIVDLLSAADREIALLNDEKDALEKQKRGLMQKLLSGEWRVPDHDAELDSMAARVCTEPAQ